MLEVEQVPDVEHVSGTGALRANDQTDLGDVVYALTVIQEPHGDLTVAGEFAFVAAPLDVGDYAQVSLELADDTWLAIDLTYQDPTQNIYSFAGIGVYRARGA